METIERGREMEELYGHLFDQVIINYDIDRAFQQLKGEINRLEVEPQWVPYQWVHFPNASSDNGISPLFVSWKGLRRKHWYGIEASTQLQHAHWHSIVWTWLSFLFSVGVNHFFATRYCLIPIGSLAPASGQVDAKFHPLMVLARKRNKRFSNCFFCITNISYFLSRFTFTGVVLHIGFLLHDFILDSQSDFLCCHRVSESNFIPVFIWIKLHIFYRFAIDVWVMYSCACGCLSLEIYRLCVCLLSSCWLSFDWCSVCVIFYWLVESESGN